MQPVSVRRARLVDLPAPRMAQPPPFHRAGRTSYDSCHDLSIMTTVIAGKVPATIGHVGHERSNKRMGIELGFIGLGVMSQPMALNLARAGTDLVVWNRTQARCEPLRAAGARLASSPEQLFARTSRVIMRRSPTCSKTPT
jgi:NAD binding domain of 6-phosphogluconate dehydrogenase